MRQLCLILCLHALYFQISLANSTEQNYADNNVTQELEIDNLIYGGITVNKRSEYSFAAKLYITFRGEGNTICTGVVLTSKLILTVAQCVSRPGGQKADWVWAGIQGGGMYKFFQNEIIVNPGYNKVYGADFAVLRKGSTIFPMRGFGTPPTLPPNLSGPDSFVPYIGVSAVIVGWGRTSDTNQFFNYPIKLQAANVNIMPTDENTCANTYPEVYQSMAAGERLLCTFNNIAGVCAGDWGSPLLVGNTVVGLAVFRRGSCSNQNNNPSAFTDVQNAAEWLRVTFDLK